MSEPEAEAWERLLFHLENQTGFWFAMVVGDDPVARGRLYTKAKGYCEEQGVAFERITPPPQESRSIAITLAQAELKGVRWIVLDGPKTIREQWDVAAIRLASAMNERRDAYRKRFDGGIILEGRMVLKRIVRESAPDLFSIRAFIAEPEPEDSDKDIKRHIPSIPVVAEWNAPNIVGRVRWQTSEGQMRELEPPEQHELPQVALFLSVKLDLQDKKSAELIFLAIEMHKNLYRAQTLVQSGDLSGAVLAYKEQVTIAVHAVAEMPDWLEGQLLLLEHRWGLVHVYKRMGDMAEHKRTLLAIVEQAGALADAHPLEQRWPFDQACALLLLAVRHQDAQRMSEVFSAALRVMSPYLRSPDEDWYGLSRKLLVTIALMLVQTNRPDDVAINWLDETVALLNDPPSAMFNVDHARLLAYRGAILDQAGDGYEAREDMERASGLMRHAAPRGILRAWLPRFRKRPALFLLWDRAAPRRSIGPLHRRWQRFLDAAGTGRATRHGRRRG